MCAFFFFQAEDGIRDLVRSRGLGDVYKRQPEGIAPFHQVPLAVIATPPGGVPVEPVFANGVNICLLYTSDAADERSV